MNRLLGVLAALLCFSAVFAKQPKQCNIPEAASPAKQLELIGQGRIKELVACGLNLNQTYTTEAYGQAVTMTPLQLMAIAGNMKAVKQLVQNGANLDYVPDKDGSPAVDQAVFFEKYDVALYLAEHNAKLDYVQPSNGQTLLMVLALTKESPATANKLFAVLLKRGPDINAKNINGSTALHIAVGRKNLFYAERLLVNKADPCITDNKGRTPADLAKDRGLADYAKKLADKCPQTSSL